MRNPPIGRTFFPLNFEPPDLFRRRRVQDSETLPNLRIPAFPVYVVLSMAPAYWVYLGDRYHRDHPQFSVSGQEADFAARLLAKTIPDALLRLVEFKQPQLEIAGHMVAAQVGCDLAAPHREAALQRFLEAAETIIEAVGR